MPMLYTTLVGGTGVQSGDFVRFNWLNYDTSGITYEVATGEVTIHEPGNYTVHWWVATQSTASSDVVFSLVRTEPDVEVPGSTRQKNGQVTGMAALTVFQPVTLRLRYDGASPLYFASNLPLQAGLLVSGEIAPAFGSRWATTEGGTLLLDDRLTTLPLPEYTILRQNVDFIDNTTISILYAGMYRLDAMVAGVPGESGTVTLAIAFNGAIYPDFRQTLTVAANVPVTFTFTNYAALYPGTILTLMMDASQPMDFVLSPLGISAMLSVQRVAL